jgi:hypothetical protein
MILVKQHIPNFVDTGEAAPIEMTCNTLDEVLALPFIKQWDDEFLDHFEKSSYGSIWTGMVVNSWLLMAIMKDGRFWVVAYLITDDNLRDLPLWKGPKQ